MKYPAYASDRYQNAEYTRVATAQVRWLIKNGKAELQQLYRDGFGDLHWVTVPVVIHEPKK